MANYNNVSEMAWMEYLRRMNYYGMLAERDEAALFAQCVELQVLKAPASAMFPPLDQMIVNGSYGRYNVSGFVDSQNSYGAMVRTQYSYSIEKDYTGRWRCNNQFVDTNTQIQTQIISHTILWWVLGIIGSLITIGFSYWQMSSLF